MTHYVWFRRILLAVGLLSGLGATLVLRLLWLFDLSQLADGGYDRVEGRTQVWMVLGILLFSLLAMATSWGLKYVWKWAIWSAWFCSVLLIVAGFPWFALVGVYGIYALRNAPRPDAARKSAGSIIGSSILHGSAGVALMAGWGFLARYAEHWDLPPGWLGYWTWPVLAACEIVVVAAHELGHLTIAMALGFRVRSVCVGPATWSLDDRRKHRFQWNWGKLFGGGGYVGAIPVSEEHLRAHMILVVAAGPAISLLSAASLFAILQASAGRPWEQYWEILAVLTMLSAITGVWSLIPAGRNDGGMLASLILWNEKGRQLAADLMSGKLHDDSNSLRLEGNTEAEIEALSRALAKTQAAGSGAEQLFHSHLALGFAQLRAGDRAEAERHLDESLKLLGKMEAPNPSYAPNVWMGLRGVYKGTERPAEAARAYEHSIAAFEEVLQKGPPVPQAAAIRAAVARMHADQGQFARGLEDIDRVLPFFKTEELQRADLLCHKAECEFNLGLIDSGLASTAEAERLIRAELELETTGRQAIAHLPALAEALENGDYMDRAIALLRETVKRDEAAGLDVRARHLRYGISRRLRRAGRREEAEAVLPPAAEVPERDRADFLMTRARLHHSIEDFEEAIRIIREKHSSRRVLLAIVQCGLAEAYQRRGRADEARDQAQTALAVLRDAGHPDEADALVTLALLDWPAQPEAAEAQLARAVEILTGSERLRTAERARAFDLLAQRLEEDGGVEPWARRFRSAAREQRARLDPVAGYPDTECAVINS